MQATELNGMTSAPVRLQVRELPATAPQTVENGRPSGSGSGESTISLGPSSEICVGIAPSTGLIWRDCRYRATSRAYLAR